jgi:hypothetical protein
MNKFKLVTFFVIFSLVIGTGCSNSSSSRVDLDRVLQIMAATLTSVEKQALGFSKDEIMTVFEQEFHQDINKARPKLHPQTIGVKLQNDASVIGYNDKNSNAIQDGGEKLLFKVEIDQEGGRLLASEGQQVREHRGASGFFMGYLMASMIGRQRSAGVRPNSFKNRTVTPKTTSTSTSKKSNSAKSRSKSGSYSRGK